MKMVKKELVALFHKKSIQIPLLYLIVISVLVGFAGPGKNVIRILGTQIDRIPFAVVSSFSMMLPPVLVIMVTCSVADGFQRSDAYGPGVFWGRLAAMWAAGILAFLVLFLPCCLLWCVKFGQSWLAGDAPQYGLKLAVYFAAVILLTLGHITCCYMVSLLTKDMIAATLICLIVTIAFDIFGASESAVAVLTPSGALFGLTELVSKDALLDPELLRTVAPGLVLTMVLSVWGLPVYKKRKKHTCQAP